MKVFKDDSERIVEIWLSNEDQKNEQIQNEVNNYIKTMKANKYLVCMYCSGSRDLTADTTALLLHNKI